MGESTPADSGNRPPEGGTAADDLDTALNNEIKRDDRRVHRWAFVGIGLLLALCAVAYGAWWLALGIVVVAIGATVWAAVA